MKTIPNASDDLIARAGRYADRLSINVELPTADSLATLAPEKSATGIKRSMARIRLHLDDTADARRAATTPRSLPQAAPRAAAVPRFAPAGQSTQMIVGADRSDDRTILTTSSALYASYRLKRVYYSAFSPIAHASTQLPPAAAPLLREHRLYQADWLLRFYGFTHGEIVGASGMLSLQIDPKLAWALGHPEAFPIDINRAPRESLLRVPGLGTRSVARVLAARRHRRLRRDDLARLGAPTSKLLAFVVTADHRPAPDATAHWLRHAEPNGEALEGTEHNGEARQGTERSGQALQGELF